ncbi:MAG: periplasmic heavy metal sensor [Bryobacterales bacterium]|nr:periplasmic heavy metal sensor [Bryobacterales bacterium]
MIRLIFGFGFAFLTLSAQQPRDFFPWWDMPVARTLNLTEDQTRQIQTIVREHRDKLVDLRGAVEKAENQLSDIMDEDRPDAGKANAAIDRVAVARAELTRAFSQMGLKLRLVLTPAQWKDLQSKRPKPPLPGQPKPPLNRPPRGVPQNEDAALRGVEPADGGDTRESATQVFRRP